MSKALERRAKLREDLVLAAEKSVATGGLAGLKTRDLARQIGCANGAVYNLVEDEKGRAVFQFLPRCSHAAPEERQNSFEHLQLPVMSIAHELVVAYFEHCSRTILSVAHRNG